MRSIDGLSLECSDGRTVPATLDETNAVLRTIGAGVWPLDLRDQPAEIRDVLAKPRLDDGESERVKRHFLLPMDRLLEVIGKAGRAPQVAGGGAMETWVTNHDYGYPQLYEVEEGTDYSRFDRLHVNVAADGVGVDEVFQMLSGRGLVIRQRLDGGEMLTLKLDTGPGRGWVGTYDGTRPHVGSVSSASVGSKLLVQVIGAPRWVMRYVEP